MKSMRLLNACSEGDLDALTQVPKNEATCLDLALLIEHKEYIAHPLIQKKITEEWEGEPIPAVRFLFEIPNVPREVIHMHFLLH